MIARIFQRYYLTSDGRITHFLHDEMRCKCGCGLADMQEITIDALEAARVKSGHPMFVNSGVRCWRHNAAVDGRSNSAHPEGLATDLTSTQPLWDLSEVLGLYFSRLWTYSRSQGFFCHADMRPSRLRKILTQDREFTVPEFCAYYRLDRGVSRDKIQEVLEAT